MQGECKLFVAFIDYTEAYDTVDRDQLGINAIFLNTMYAKSWYSIKLNAEYLDALNSNLEIKQGCPMVFNICIDDLFIISRTEEDIQKSLP